MQSQYEAEHARAQADYEAACLQYEEDMRQFADTDRAWQDSNFLYETAIKAARQHYTRTVGVVWEHLDKAQPASVNGNPVFFSCRFMHTEDWKRVYPFIEQERERRANLASLFNDNPTAP